MIHPELNQPISLDHLARMTDCFGLIQHANYSLPDFRTGYTTDDNARALVVALKHHQLYREVRSLELVEQYLAFLMYAQTPDGRFHNLARTDNRQRASPALWREDGRIQGGQVDHRVT